MLDYSTICILFHYRYHLFEILALGIVMWKETALGCLFLLKSFTDTPFDATTKIRYNIFHKVIETTKERET